MLGRPIIVAWFYLVRLENELRLKEEQRKVLINDESYGPKWNGFSSIIGYDDVKKAFKVMNSWGTSWCEAGYGWIDYDFLPQTGDLGAYVMNYWFGFDEYSKVFIERWRILDYEK